MWKAETFALGDYMIFVLFAVSTNVVRSIIFIVRDRSVIAPTQARILRIYKAALILISR